MNKLLIGVRWGVMAVILLSLLALLFNIYSLWQMKRLNAFIAEPSAYEQTPNTPRALFARAGQLVIDEEPDLALEQYTIVLGQTNAPLKTEAFFNRGNINLREALEMTDADARQIPLVELAKQDYRSALLLDPEHWGARYNLEITLAMVSEDPEAPSNYERDFISSELSIESKAFKIDLP